MQQFDLGLKLSTPKTYRSPKGPVLLQIALFLALPSAYHWKYGEGEAPILQVLSLKIALTNAKNQPSTLIPASLITVAHFETSDF